MIIDRHAYDAMIEHLRQAAPREGVGLLAGPQIRPPEGQPSWPVRAGAVDRWVPLDNVSDWPGLRYEVDNDELITAYESLEGDGRRPWVIVHSHTSTSAAPSLLDIRYAVDQTLLHMIVSLAASRPVAVLWRLNPDAPPVEQARKIRYQVADLGFQTVGTTDLTRHVSGPTV